MSGKTKQKILKKEVGIRKTRMIKEKGKEDRKKKGRVKVGLWNVNGIAGKEIEIIGMIREEGIDVMVLNEVKDTLEETEDRLGKEWFSDIQQR